MKRHLFLTGDIQIGKSTLLRAWLDQISVNAGGFFTRKVIEGDSVRVHMFSAATNEEANDDNYIFDCLHRDLPDATSRFNSRGCALLEHPESHDLIIMDEIGLMENRSELFRKKVLETLDGPTPVIGVLRKSLNFPHSSAREKPRDKALISQIKERADVEVIEVTLDNRDALAQELPAILLEFRCV